MFKHLLCLSFLAVLAGSAAAGPPTQSAQIINILVYTVGPNADSKQEQSTLTNTNNNAKVGIYTAQKGSLSVSGPASGYSYGWSGVLFGSIAANCTVTASATNEASNANVVSTGTFTDTLIIASPKYARGTKVSITASQYIDAKLSQAVNDQATGMVASSSYTGLCIYRSYGLKAGEFSEGRFSVDVGTDDLVSTQVSEASATIPCWVGGTVDIEEDLIQVGIAEDPGMVASKLAATFSGVCNLGIVGASNVTFTSLSGCHYGSTSVQDLGHPETPLWTQLEPWLNRPSHNGLYG
jgi:hypothetical protein